MVIEMKGNYIFINGHSIKFDSDKLAEEFMARLIVEHGLMDK